MFHGAGGVRVGSDLAAGEDQGGGAHAAVGVQGGKFQIQGATTGGHHLTFINHFNFMVLTIVVI